MNCLVCSKPLRKDNTIGYCREHRSQSEKIKVYQKSFRAANPTISNEAKERWRKANPKYWSQRLKSNPQAKLAHIIRTRINRAIKRKPGSAIKALGITVEQLKKVIESKFLAGMTWENHGLWQIDHILPLSKFDLTSKSEFEKACNYENLQPLWKVDNLKKSNRI